MMNHQQKYLTLRLRIWQKGDLKQLIYNEVMEWNLVNNNLAGDAIVQQGHIASVVQQPPPQ